MTCHNLETNGSHPNGRHHIKGTGTYPYDIPSIFGHSSKRYYFWNGSAKTTSDVLDHHLKHPQIFGSSWRQVELKLKGPSKTEIIQALHSFLISLDKKSRFDHFLAGELKLGPKELRGLKLFLNKGCVSCHQGEGVGGNLFSTNSFETNSEQMLKGRFEVTRNLKDLFYFRVPPLRNVANTAPYYHNGSAKSLDRVLKSKLRYFDHSDVKQSDVDELQAFLKTMDRGK